MLDGVVGDDFPAMQDYDAGADAFHYLQLMGAEEHDFAARGEFLNQAAEDEARGDIQAGEWFVQQDEIGIMYHFVSWLRLRPDNRISSEKIIGKGRLPTNNRATISLKMAASTLRKSNTYLGAQFRRLRTKLGAPCAIKAMAAKLARLIYRMLRYGIKYADKGAALYRAQYRHLQIKQLKWKAASLGYQVTSIPAAA